MSKAVVATAIHMQAERGLLDIDRPIAAYWPEYAAKGKGNITTRHVLLHRAGVPHMPPETTAAHLMDWEWIVQRLADVEPLHAPGARTLYHSMSFGYLLGEVIRRTDPKHRLFSDFLHEEICLPLGIRDLWIGLPLAEEPRVAKLTWGATPPENPQVPPSRQRDLAMPRAIVPVPEVYNRPEMHRACSPGATGIMSARAGAKFFSLLANGGSLGDVRLLSRERLLALTERPREMQYDDSIGAIPWLGIGGYWVGGKHPPADPVAGTGPRSLNHGGAGGSIGWADLDSRLAVMITHNRMLGAVPYEMHPFVPLGDAVRVIARDLAA